MTKEAPAEHEMPWTDEALARLENIPEFVRPMAKKGIEHFAKEAGRSSVDLSLMEKAKGQFGMG